MEVNALNIDYFSEAKLLKLIKRLRGKINQSKVGRASARAGDNRAKEFANNLKKYRADYEESIMRLRKLRNKKENRKIRENLKKRQLENSKRESKIDDYQSQRPDKYRFISNFNKKYSVNIANNYREIFNTYL